MATVSVHQMILIGITGGVGMGKSTSASLLRQDGVPVVDTDDLARHVVEPGQPALKEIEKDLSAEEKKEIETDARLTGRASG